MKDYSESVWSIRAEWTGHQAVVEFHVPQATFQPSTGGRQAQNKVRQGRRIGT
jgi:hypothetical protein